jgi:hypothetical protein
MIKTLTVLVVLAGAGAVHAETAAPVPDMSRVVWSKPPAIDIDDPRLSLATPYAARVAPPDPTGIRRTSIDRRFESRDMVGSFGYLCGLQPGPNEIAGVASSHEPAGTFLGAKLTMALR